MLPTSRGGDPSRCPRGCHQNSSLRTWLGSQGRNPALTWSVQGCILQDLPEWALFLIYRKAAYRRHDLLTLSVLVNANSKTRVGTWHCPSLFDHGTILSQMGQGWGEVGEAELIKYGIEPCLCLKF